MPAKAYDDYVYDLEHSWDLDVYNAAYNNLMMSGGSIDVQIKSISNSTIDMDRKISDLYSKGLISYRNYKDYQSKKEKYEHPKPNQSRISAASFKQEQQTLIKNAERQKIEDLYNARLTAVTNRRQQEIAEVEAQQRIFSGGQATLSGAGTETIVTSGTTVHLTGGNPTPIGTRVTMSHTIVAKNNTWVKKPETGQDPSQLDRRPAWIDTNTEYHRVKTNQGLLVDSAIIKRYYSVIDAEIYFGNEYVEDVADVSWQIIQNVQPLFGYNSYTYDEIARGNRLIHGSFLINFTNPNYLFAILEAANKANVVPITGMTDYSVPAYTTEGTNISQGVKGRNTDRERGHHANMWPQTFDIDIIFGEKSGAGLPVHVLLLGCAIQSCQQVLSASATGSPPVVMEQYSFIGQDIRTVVAGAGHVASETNLDSISGGGDTVVAAADSNTSIAGSSDTSISGGSPSWADFQQINHPNNEQEQVEQQQDNAAASQRYQVQSVTLKTIQAKAGLPSCTVFNSETSSVKTGSNYDLFIRAAGGTVNNVTGLTPAEQKQFANALLPLSAYSTGEYDRSVSTQNGVTVYKNILYTQEEDGRIIDDAVLQFTEEQIDLMSKGLLSYE